MREYASHGVVKERHRQLKKDQPDWYYEQQQLGFNYRLSDLNAALGCSQLQRLPEFLQRRRAIAHRYDRAFHHCRQIQTPTLIHGCQSSWHLYVIQVESTIRDALFAYLRAADIYVQLHYFPVDQQPFYDTGIHQPQADQHGQRALSLPIFPDLDDAQQQQVIDRILYFLSTQP